MDKLRKSFRESFKKRKDSIPESSKPHLWQSDESAVRAGTCQFNVKYRGCVEVFESRGMQVCEEALKVLRASRRVPVRGVLYVSGDGLRVVDDDTKGLIVDQTIEKVSFCAPDRNHERGFSYICRDGTTRRWMCHGFIAVKDSGERLSHAVGCAFAACLERKQKRDNKCDVTMTFDDNTSTFTRMGSFRQMSLTERLSDPQECKPTENVPVKKVENPHAIERPHATPQTLQRQGSFRGFDHMNQFPFKRQLSLRLNELPSNLARQNKNNFDQPLDNNITQNINNNGNTIFDNSSTTGVNPGFNDGLVSDLLSPSSIPNNQRNRLHSLSVTNMTPIPESAPLQTGENGDPVSAMCQQVSAGLQLLSTFSDSFMSPTERKETFTPLPSNPGERINVTRSSPVAQNIGVISPTQSSTDTEWKSNKNIEDTLSPLMTSGLSKGEEWLSQLNAQGQTSEGGPFGGLGELSSSRRAPPLSQLRSASLGAAPMTAKLKFRPKFGQTSPLAERPGVARTDLLTSRTNTVNPNNVNTSNIITFPAVTSSINPKNAQLDPFDAGWVSLEDRSTGVNTQGTMPQGLGAMPVNPNNPFLNNTVTTAFQVQM